MYNLIFFLVGNDQVQPLVISQTFEQAYTQSKLIGANKPNRVEVWYLCEWRDFFRPRYHNWRRYMSRRFPSLRIVPIWRLYRLEKITLRLFLNLHLLRHNKNIVLHFRGESAQKKFQENAFIKKYTSVLDVRGHWPAEYFYKQGFFDIELLNGVQQETYKTLMNEVHQQMKKADGLVFVTGELQYELQRKNIAKPFSIVPCVASGHSKQVIQKELLQKENTIVYAGTNKKYQHLEDVTLPFIKLFLELNPHWTFKVLSRQNQEIRELCIKAGISLEQCIFKSVDQQEVFNELKACKIGVLLRKPSLVNRVAQPVKVAEYLAAGLCVVYHEGTTGIEGLLDSYDAGFKVNLDGKSLEDWRIEVSRLSNWIVNFDFGNPLKLWKEKLNWNHYVPQQRAFYSQLMKHTQ